jgi:diguanylate cyclase (GGDEF)-like protein
MDAEILKKLKLLYVEDEEEIRDQLSRFLKRRVGTLYTAKNGEEGAELFREHRPDLVVTDIKMPVMNGLEMAEAIREVDRDVPIIVATAFNELKYFMKSIEVGIDEYVLKPVNTDALMEALIKCAAVVFQRREIEAENRFIKLILDSSPSFMLTTKDEEIRHVNKTFLNYLGYSSLGEFHQEFDKVEDFFTAILSPPYPEQDARALVNRIICNTDVHSIAYLKPTRSDNPPIACMIFCNKSSELGRHVYSLTDVTHLENEKRDLERQATIDGLTGVYNRAKFNSMLLTEISRVRRYSEPLSLIMFDMDRFKSINDTFGHQEGDVVLKGVAELVSASVREQDLFARWGGEEFMTLALESELEGTKMLAEKLRKAIEEADFGLVGTVTCSFGVTEFKKDDSAESFVKRADDALYKAKDGGRNRVEVL